MKNCMSASSMWAANAATVSPSADSADDRLHFTPANLSTMLHRSIEHPQTQRALQTAFPFATVHQALAEQSVFADEGAANHVRLCNERGGQGVELFVYGRDGYAAHRPGYPARQTLQASQAIARSHQLNPDHTVYALQSDAAIDAGAFHNDVVCVGALQTLFYHELAFANTAQMQAEIRTASEGLFTPNFVEVPLAEVPIADAIKAYLFNSMLVQMPHESRLTLIAPLETQENTATKNYCDKLVASNGPIGEVRYVDVRQSMRNGGGPACLRLRVTLTEAEWAQVNEGNKFSPARYEALKAWINKHYRESLSPGDTRDVKLMTESFAALDELTEIMGLGAGFYPFQR
jgi:succinylarginine dihydrolase